MKKLITFTLITLLSISYTSAQTQKQINKEREKIAKLSKKELNSRSSKEARKTSKRLSKEGWIVAPGQLPLEKQFDKSYNIQYEYDKDLLPKYIMGEAMSVGGNYDATKIQALELAKQNIATQIQTKIAIITESSISNKQLDEGEVMSITKTISASKSLISQNIGRIIPIVECYRILPNNNKEVRIQIAYDSKIAKENAKKTILKELAKENKELSKKLNDIL